MSANLTLLETRSPESGEWSGDGLRRGQVLGIDGEGWVDVRLGNRERWRCLALEGTALGVGDAVLVLAPTDEDPAVVVGRFGPYQRPQLQSKVTIEAGETLTLKCGESSLELRSDGKAVLKGDDVLIRAKGLQRIKAGSVSIN